MIVASLLLLAAAAQDSEIDCANGQTQFELNACAAQDFDRADTELNAQWTLTVAAMKARDKDVDRTYDSEPGYYDTLLAAQRAWLIYRDQHCANKSFSARGGSMAAMLFSFCAANLTLGRTQQLKDLTEEY